MLNDILLHICLTYSDDQYIYIYISLNTLIIHIDGYVETTTGWNPVEINKSVAQLKHHSRENQWLFLEIPVCNATLHYSMKQ